MFINLYWLVVICVICILSTAIDPEIDIKDNITNFSIINYPSSLPSNVTRVWKLKAANGSRIVIRKRYVMLFPGDELTLYDCLDNSRTILAKYTTWNSSTNKSVSLGDTVTVELTSTINYTFSSLVNESLTFAFDFSLEIAGFCSPNSTDRVSCEYPQKPSCFSAQEDRCDGFWDCPINGIDEINCSCHSDTEFACADFAVSGACYNLSQRCDGVRHCLDKSDELGCLESQCSPNALRFLCVPLNSSTSVTGECIGLERICDDHVDCANGADEEPHLCRHSPTTNTSNTIGSTSVQQALIAQRFAAQVAREAVKEAVATAVSRVESRLRTLLTYVLSALLGPLLIVLTVGLMCRSSAASAAAGRRSADEARRARQQARFNSPIQRLIRDEIRRRPPPPTYEEALNNSLFEEPILEGAVPPPLPEPLPGALSQDRIAAVRELSMKPAPTRVDVAISCDLLLGDPIIVTHPVQQSGRNRRRHQNVLTAFVSSPSQATPTASSTVSEEDGVDGSQSSAEEVSGQGLFGRWFMSALGGWRRGGNNSGVSNMHYEQPEMSETTVVSSMHEDEEGEDYVSLASRPESASAEEGDGYALDENSMSTERSHVVATTDVEQDNSVASTPLEGGGGDGSDDTDNNSQFPGLRTPLLTSTLPNVFSTTGNV